MYKHLFFKHLQCRYFLRFFKTLCINRKANLNWRNKYHLLLKNRNSTNLAVQMHTRKQFSLSNYNIIGFDLDGTLLRYNLDALAPLINDALIDYLVKQKLYPKVLLESNFNPDFIQKGLIIDTHRGNIVKLSSGGRILRASHGTRRLSLDEIEDIYGENMCWQLAKKFSMEPLSVYQGPDTDKLHSLLDFFDYSAALVFAQAVDVIDETMTVQPPAGYRVWSDILDGLITLYRQENFDNDKSYIYKAIKAEPARYLLRTSGKVLQWIDELRSVGKSLYLLTGSYEDYANFVSTYAMGSDWRKYFDFVICNARKPVFFNTNTRFLETDKNGGRAKRISFAQYLTSNKIYSRGNWQQLYDSLKYINKFQKDEPTLYIGDNLLQDVYAPSLCGIHTVAVCEELLIDCSKSEFKHSLPSKYWGSYFLTDNRTTHWSKTIKTYANLCIPSLEVLADLPINSQLKFNNYGNFYPKLPNAFKSNQN